MDVAFSYLITAVFFACFGAVVMALFSARKSTVYGWRVKSLLRRCSAMSGRMDEALQIRKDAKNLLYKLYNETDRREL